MKRFIKNKFFILAVVLMVIAAAVPTALTLSGKGSYVHNAVNVLMTPLQKGFNYVTDALDGFTSYFTKFDDVVKENARLKEEIASLKKANLVSDHKAKLLGLGYDEELANETATAMADGDTAKVFENQQKFLKAHDKQIEAELLKKTPRNGEGGTGGDIDYAKKAAEAQAAGDFTSAAYYTRLAQENKE